MDGIVFVSPNFGLNLHMERLLDLPMARVWAPLVAGRERCFTPVNAGHARYWTACYPTEALLPMAALARHAGQADYGAVRVPALFLYSPGDRVVRPAATKAVAEDWGGAEVEEITPGPKDDPWSHILAGDILSPSMTAPVAARVLDWAKGL